MAPRLATAHAALFACVAVYASTAVAESATASVVGVSPELESRGQLALVIDRLGVEWCGDNDVCSRMVRVLGVVRNRKPYLVPHTITLFRKRGHPAITAQYIFLRIECGTGTPLWRVFPASEPVTQESPIYGAVLGPANVKFEVR